MVIQNLIDCGANITLSVGANDLKEFAEIIAEQTRQKIEKDIAESKTEVYYTTEQVTGIFNVDKTSLWRWSKRDYLVPIKVGGLLRYRKSDVDKILNYRKEARR